MVQIDLRNSGPRLPGRGGLRRRVTRAAGIAALLLGLAPAVAAAHTQRVVALGVAPVAAARTQSTGASGAAALAAYRTYLNALSAGSSTSAGRDSQFVQNVENTCPNALSDLSQLSSGQLKRSALSDFGDEVDADLDLAYMAPSRPALNRLAGTLTGLSWSTSQPSVTTSRLIAAERAMLNLTPSNLCADANTVDAAPLSEPVATIRFLRGYRAAAKNLHGALRAFQTLLSGTAGSSQPKLVTQINGLVSRFSDESSATEQSAASTTLSDLGI